MCLGLKIKALMSQENIEVSELAIQLGKSKQAIYDMLEKNDLNTSILRDLSKIFEVPISYFFEDNNSTNPNTKGNSNVVVGRDSNGNIQLDKCHDDLETALREIQYLKALIKEKDERLDEKERLINVLMNK